MRTADIMELVKWQNAKTKEKSCIRIHYKLYEAITWKWIALDATQISCTTHVCTEEAACIRCLWKPLLRQNKRQRRFVWDKKHMKWRLDQWNLCFGVIQYVQIWDLLFYRVFFGQEKRNAFLVCTCMGPTAKHGGGAVIVLCWWYGWGFTHLAFLCLNLSLPNCRYSFPTTLFLNPLRQVSALHCPPAQRRCTLVCVTVISLTAAR